MQTSPCYFESKLRKSWLNRGSWHLHLLQCHCTWEEFNNTLINLVNCFFFFGRYTSRSIISTAQVLLLKKINDFASFHWGSRIKRYNEEKQVIFQYHWRALSSVILFYFHAKLCKVWQDLKCCVIFSKGITIRFTKSFDKPYAVREESHSFPNNLTITKGSEHRGLRI